VQVRGKSNREFYLTSWYKNGSRKMHVNSTKATTAVCQASDKKRRTSNQTSKPSRGFTRKQLPRGESKKTEEEVAEE
jgi:hypothetical protein